MDFIFDDIKVHAHGLMQYDPNELREYVRRGKQKFGTNLRGLELKFDNDYVDIEYITPTAGLTAYAGSPATMSAMFPGGTTESERN